MNEQAIKNKNSERFIIVYNIYKMKYLKNCGHRYLFKCIDEGKNRPNRENSIAYFWVFDRTKEVEDCLDNYK